MSMGWPQARRRIFCLSMLPGGSGSGSGKGERRDVTRHDTTRPDNEVLCKYPGRHTEPSAPPLLRGSREVSVSRPRIHTHTHTHTHTYIHKALSNLHTHTEKVRGNACQCECQCALLGRSAWVWGRFDFVDDWRWSWSGLVPSWSEVRGRSGRGCFALPG